MENDQSTLSNTTLSNTTWRTILSEICNGNCNKSITSIVNRIEITEREKFVSNNLEKIKDNYSWETILSNYESFMQSCLKN